MKFLEALSERVLVAEGAMGTHLFSKGIAPGECLEALNLSNPGLIREIHEEYRDARAEIFKTNTFGANAARLARHNLAAHCREITIAGVRIARSVAGEEGFVAGAVGPLSEQANLDTGKIFGLQIEALAEAGADFILLETFRNFYELEEAIHAAHAACDLPVVAQVSPDERGNLEGGIGPEIYVSKLNGWGVDAMGCNCGAGLASMLETIRRMALLTDKPLSAQPSAGIPFIQDGQTVYSCLPEEMADAAGQSAEIGARIVGGCCGTTPEHIAAIRAVLPGNVRMHSR
ncbi:MAG: homocysteine S-methyltransferase family protein [Acidobacteria bacterium]|nr:homocysteine S-methyltransferase family protein [Acidobacteriota bacterium]